MVRADFQVILVMCLKDQTVLYRLVNLELKIKHFSEDSVKDIVAVQQHISIIDRLEVLVKTSLPFCLLLGFPPMDILSLLFVTCICFSVLRQKG
jgi:hypothetical protein